MKQLFRFFRGEFNGWFTYALCTFLNIYLTAEGIIKELIYAFRSQWILEADQTQNSIALREADYEGIAVIAGIFRQRLSGETNYGSIWFTQSSKTLHPGFPERNERGLARKDWDDFIFVRIERDTYDNDINTIATDKARSTLVENGAALVGYVAEGTQLYQQDGTIIESAILPAPPSGMAYIELYKSKYLHFEEIFYGVSILSLESFKRVIEVAQQIRRNGASLSDLIELTEILVEGYVSSLRIEWTDGFCTCYYKLDENSSVIDKTKRYRAWEIITQMKFPLVTFALEET